MTDGDTLDRLIASVERLTSEMTRGFALQRASIDRLTTEVVGVSTRIDAVQAAVENVDIELSAFTTRLEGVERRLDLIERRVKVTHAADLKLQTRTIEVESRHARSLASLGRRVERVEELVGIQKSPLPHERFGSEPPSEPPAGTSG